LTESKIREQISLPPEGSLICSFNGEPRHVQQAADKFWGLTISADGVYAIAAAVVIVLVVVLVSRWSPS
jgi:hypothetical protein